MRGRHLVAAITGILLMAGCHNQAADTDANGRNATPVPVKMAGTPEEAVHEQLRSGKFQLEGCLDSIEASLDAAKKLDKAAKGEAKEALDDVVDRINSVGEVLGNQHGEAPSLEEVKKNFAANDDLRLKAIDDVNDALTELRETQKIVDSLADAATDPKPYDDLSDLLDTAIEDAKGTLEAFGGKEVAPTSSDTLPGTTAPDPSAPDQTPATNR